LQSTLLPLFDLAVNPWKRHSRLLLVRQCSATPDLAEDFPSVHALTNDNNKKHCTMLHRNFSLKVIDVSHQHS